MKIGIASHVVLDIINGKDGKVKESMGGPACYCGILSRRFGFDVELATRVGSDFHEDKRNFLRDNNITLKEWQVQNNVPTTRFSLEMQGDSRQLVLHSKCDQLTVQEVQDMKVDCWLVSPVMDEVPQNVLHAIKKNPGKKKFIMLDPQGYMRIAESNGRISFKDRIDIDLSGITALKVDKEEMAALTGGLQGIEGMKALQSVGIEFILATERGLVQLLHKKMHYWIKIKEVETPDSTGAGDILSAAFACAWVREKDPVWAICFSAGALKAALDTKTIGLGKVPAMNTVETEASYYYNTLSFQKV